MQTSRTHEPHTARFSEADRAAIRSQMERMLANPLFKNSKRFPVFWRYVVERTLEGHAAELKERTLGVEVFGREPNYDTNADPIVRATAGEIRKRIAQYYDNEHKGEIRITLSPGSYVPEFDLSVAPPLPVPPPPIPPALNPGAAPVRRSRRAGIIAVAALGASLAGMFLLKPWQSRAAIDQFWGPVLESPGSVLLCIGQRSFLAASQEPRKPVNPDVALVAEAAKNPEAPIKIFAMYFTGSQNVALSDAKTLARLAALLNVRGKAWRILGESTASLADLRDGPVVLVGGFNNDWTMRLTGPMRFSFDRNEAGFWIRDRQNPSNRDYSVAAATPYLDLAQDYALISRVLDPTTDRMVVVAAGLTGYGTMAAGEFLASRDYMAVAVKQAPPHWERKNIQWVITTKVINGSSGPPRVVERYFW